MSNVGVGVTEQNVGVSSAVLVGYSDGFKIFLLTIWNYLFQVTTLPDTILLYFFSCSVY